MITYKDILVNSFAYSYKYYMAHIYFYMPWGGWIFADDIGNHHAELSKTNRIYSI